VKMKDGDLQSSYRVKNVVICEGSFA